MYQQDWLDALRWRALLIGVLLAVSLQVVATFVVIIPFDLSLGWASVALVELCIAIGAFVAAWRAREHTLLNGVATALCCAVVSLIATVANSPASLDALSILFLFGTFAVMGALGSFVANRLLGRNDGPVLAHMPVRKLGR